jgi:DNA-binding response OmpR family regulator
MSLSANAAPYLPATILVVDDEDDLLRLVRYNLLKEGFTVLCAEDGKAAHQELENHTPDLVLLDLMLPDQSGFEICRHIKANPATKHTPVIMLTARSSEHDRVSGFESGAEDYVVKPFSPKELILRVKALLTRVRQPVPEKGTVIGKPPITIGALTLYPSEYRVTVNDTPVQLTHIEFDILRTLAEQPNRVHSREQILAAVWADEAELVLDRTVDAHMKRLRHKLGPDARDVVETVRGVGYRIAQPDAAIATR